MKIQIRIAVAGCGYWGKNLVRNMHELGALTAICDDNEVASTQFAKQYNVPALTWDEILAANHIDGVVIATPALSHAKMVKEALKSGKHVFVEKPIALSVEDAQECRRLASQHGKKLMVGHLLQYHPAFVQLKQYVKSGKLGRLQYIYSTRLNLGKLRREENSLWSFAPHDISMILSLARSQPDSVLAIGGNYLRNDVADVTTMHMFFPNNLQARIFVSWLHPFKEQRLVVVGDKGMIVFNDQAMHEQKLQFYSDPVIWDGSDPEIQSRSGEFIPTEDCEPLRKECQHFIDCIRCDLTPLTNGEEGKNVLEVLNAAQLSMDNGNKKINLNQQIDFYRHETVIVDEGATVGAGSKIWHYTHISKNAKIGENCVLGQNVFVGQGVSIGNGCKIQNNVSVYNGVTLEENVFCGPSCVFTNVNNPRANVERKDEFSLTYVGRGVTIGANATIVCGVDIGEYAFIAAGAVVTKDVNPHALMAGVPARQIGWVSRCGEVLKDALTCPRTGESYRIVDGRLVLKAEAELSPTLGK
ncbi:MAG: Gfo/Idh/MocA family oxidoreductase [Elusimicrobia bacterium]|nr:Gfo/Idh/MocA family oxidoreductase [Elusimicrobiota bacterium]